MLFAVLCCCLLLSAATNFFEIGVYIVEVSPCAVRQANRSYMITDRDFSLEFNKSQVRVERQIVESTVGDNL
jgi:hypothetical protein